MNIHLFDGQVDPCFLRNLEIPELTLEIRNFSNHPSWQTIINDWNQPANYDNLNNLRAENLCYSIVNKFSKLNLIEADLTSFFLIFNEQLDDMQSGLCPQGRAVRLFQILQLF